MRTGATGGLRGNRSRFVIARHGDQSRGVVHAPKGAPGDKSKFWLSS